MNRVKPGDADIDGSWAEFERFMTDPALPPVSVVPLALGHAVLLASGLACPAPKVRAAGLLEPVPIRLLGLLSLRSSNVAGSCPQVPLWAFACCPRDFRFIIP